MSNMMFISSEVGPEVFFDDDISPDRKIDAAKSVDSPDELWLLGQMLTSLADE
ncbi:MAG: hypothetical protein ACI395_04610 [Candidatus Cryptobacteroides sp.]